MFIINTDFGDPTIGTRLASAPVANVREVRLIFERFTMNFGARDETFLHIKNFFDRFEDIPSSQNRLDVVVLISPLSTYYEIFSIILKILNNFSRPLTVYLDRLHNLEVLSESNARSIRRLYLREFREFNYKSSWVEAERVEKSGLIDVGLFKGFNYKEITRPRDQIDVARSIINAPDSEPDLNPFHPHMAYALRCNRDILNRFHTVCALMMLSLRPVITKDCVRLIIRHLSQKDWDFRGQKRRNITQKTSKHAKQLIELELERRKKKRLTRDSEELLREMEEEHRTYEKRHKEALQKLERSKKEEKEAQAKRDEILKKIKI